MLVKLTLVQQFIAEPVSYGDLVYNFKLTIGKHTFSDHIKKIIKRYEQ